LAHRGLELKEASFPELAGHPLMVDFAERRGTWEWLPKPKLSADGTLLAVIHCGYPVYEDSQWISLCY